MDLDVACVSSTKAEEVISAQFQSLNSVQISVEGQKGKTETDKMVSDKMINN